MRWVEAERIAGVINLHPGFDCVLIVFDPLVVTHEELETRLKGAALDAVALPVARTVEIPVRYGGADGPDLAGVAEIHGMVPDRVVEIHSSQVYPVRFLGFAPGFAYLSGVPDTIATPRLPAPRKAVPAGSVGIAGSQTGVYPFSTPGGWRLIGRTPLEMFRPDRAEMSLLRIGDLVRFVPE